MSIRSSGIAGKPSLPFDFKRHPLSIRSLGQARPSPRAVIDRMRGEFAEMRGFSPTLAQAARLFDLPSDECARLLSTLVQDGSLRQSEDGRYRLR